MTEGTVATPFGDEELGEISLTHAPIDLVLAQIRYPRLSKLANGDQLVMRFADAVADTYPIFDPVQQAVGLLVGPEGIKPTQETSRIWRIRSADDNLTVSITDNFLAFQVKSYPGRTKFAQNLSAILAQFVEIVKPPFVERLGVRYINRIHDSEILKRMPSMIRTEVLGVSFQTLPADVALNHSISESVYSLKDRMLQVRSGYLSPGIGHDPIIQVADHPTWILDLDAFSNHRTNFTIEDLDALYKDLASTVYRYFRWAVTQNFLESHGARSAEQ